MASGGFTVWLAASRPKTLWAAGAPVVMAAAMAAEAGVLHWPSLAACFLGAVCIQIGTNFANDYFDFVKGTDTEERVGPTRATAAGLVSPVAMRNATALLFTLALIPGAYIIGRGGWPYAVIGALSIASGILYTGGPKPLGYIGLGDVFVFIFFGPVAVAGTYYLQTFAVTPEVWIASLAPACLSVALLTVNNLRDADTDVKTGKRTLAVRFGKRFAMYEYFFMVLTACFIVPLYLYSRTGKLTLAAVAMICTAIITPAIRVVFTYREPAALNAVLARTGILLLVFSILFAVAWLR